MIDARVLVRFGVADPKAAALIEDGLPDQPACTTVRFPPPATTASEHAAGCACCAPREAMTEALRQLFLGRVKGHLPFFHAVCVFTGREGEATLRSALREDALLTAWYRLAPDSSIKDDAA